MLDKVKQSRPIQFGILFLVFLFSYFFIPHSENNILWRLPPLLKDVPTIIQGILDNLMFEWLTVPVWDPVWQDYEDKTIFRIITRAISSSFLFVIIFIREILLGGARTLAFFTSDALSANKFFWPAIPWTVVVAGAAILGYQLQGIRLALLAGLGFFYVSIFGQWEPSLQTLSFILVSAPVCFILGLSLGICGYLSRNVEVELVDITI